MVAMNVANFAGTSESVEKPNVNGRQAATGSRPIVFSNEDLTAIGAIASQVTLASVLSILGAAGDAASLTTSIKAVLRQMAATGIPITTLPALPAGTNNIGDVDIASMPAVTGTVTANIGTGLDKGPGSATPTTLLVTHDTNQMGSLFKGSVPTVSGGWDYHFVDHNEPNHVLETSSGTGAIGDYLETLVVVVTNPSDCNVRIGDGVTPNWDVIPNLIESGVNTYHISLGIRSKVGSWRISTADGSYATVTGRWT